MVSSIFFNKIIDSINVYIVVQSLSDMMHPPGNNPVSSLVFEPYLLHVETPNV